MVEVVALFIPFYAEDNRMTATQWLAQLMTPSTTSAGYYRFYLLSTSNCCLLVLIIVLSIEKYFNININHIHIVWGSSYSGWGLQ